jgi:hypothetical protein
VGYKPDQKLIKTVRPGTYKGQKGLFVYVRANPHFHGSFSNDEVDPDLGNFFSSIWKAINPVTQIKSIINVVQHPGIKNLMYAADPMQNIPIVHRLTPYVGTVAAYFIPYVGAVMGPIATAALAASKQRDMEKAAESAIAANNAAATAAINQLLNQPPIDPATATQAQQIAATGTTTSGAPSYGGGGGGGVAANPAAQLEQTIAGWSTNEKLAVGGGALLLLYLIFRKKKR